MNSKSFFCSFDHVLFCLLLSVNVEEKVGYHFLQNMKKSKKRRQKLFAWGILGNRFIACHSISLYSLDFQAKSCSIYDEKDITTIKLAKF
jgi:hypothetical protein